MRLRHSLLIVALGLSACPRASVTPSPEASPAVPRPVPRASSLAAEKTGPAEQPTASLPETIDGPLDVAAGAKVRVSHSVVIGRGGRLTIAAGATLSFGAGSALYVAGGTLRANGTSDRPVRFTAAAAQPVAGDWGGIWFKSWTEGTALEESVLEHVVVEYGGRAVGPLAEREQYADADGGIFVGVSYGRPKPNRPITLRHVLFRDNAHRGLDAPADAAIRAEGLAFGRNGGVSARIDIAVAEQLGSSPTETVELEGPLRRGSVVLAKQIKPYRIRNVLMIGTPGPATLEIAEGATVEFGEGGRLDVGALGQGTLTASGVTFTSASATPRAGDWEGFVVLPGSSFHLDRCRVEFAGYSRQGVIRVNTDDARMHIDHTVFQHNAGPALLHHTSCRHWLDTALGNTSIGQPLCETR